MNTLQPFKGKKKKLWAAAIEYYDNGEIQTDIRYCHAHTEIEARRTVLIGCKNRTFKIVAISPVIGYNQLKDRRGKLYLSV